MKLKLNLNLQFGIIILIRCSDKDVAEYACKKFYMNYIVEFLPFSDLIFFTYAIFLVNLFC